jgi:hypothetical protein
VKVEILTQKQKMAGKMSSVTYIMLIEQVNFSIENVVKVLLFTVTPVMREHNQNSRLQCSFHVMKMAATNYLHMQLANMKAHIA